MFYEKNVFLLFKIINNFIIIGLKHKVLYIYILALSLLIPVSTEAQNGQSLPVKRNDFKFTLLSLGSGSTRVTYERAFNPHNSAEITLGFIGLGWDWMNNSDPQGLLVKLAYKWRLVPQRSSSSWLAGFYLKPEFVTAHYAYSYYADASSRHRIDETTSQYALLAEGGYQWVCNWFVFDIYSGLGPSFGSGNRNNYYHSFMLFPIDGYLAFTAGFRIGVAF